MVQPAELEARAFSVTSLAEAWGLHPQTIRKLINARELEHVRIGRRIVIPASAAAKYLREHAA